MKNNPTKRPPTIRKIKTAILFVAIFFLFSGIASALPSFLEISPTKLRFEYAGNSTSNRPVIRTGYYWNEVSNTSAGTSDSVVGQMQVMYVPDHPYTYNYDHELVEEISPGVWTLSTNTPDEESVVEIGADAYAGGKTFFQGTALATYIDFNKGEIGWDPLTDFEINNSIGSETLDNFSQFSTLHMDFKFTTGAGLREWVNNPDSRHYTTDYKSRLSTTPEPGQWALMIGGLGVLGFAAYRRKREEA